MVAAVGGLAAAMQRFSAFQAEAQSVPPQEAQMHMDLAQHAQDLCGQTASLAHQGLRTRSRALMPC